MLNGDDYVKKVFASLGVILLVVILGVAVVFAYGSYKDLELKKEEAKLEDEKNKKIDKNKTTENENQNQVSTENIQQDNVTNEVNNEKAKQLEKAFNISSEEARILANEIDAADTNGDRIITTQEMTPTLQKFSEAGKFQPAAGGATPPSDSEGKGQSKYTAEDAKNMSDDEFLAAYKEGMSEKEAAAGDSKAKGSGDYINYLRGQVEARANGQGGTY